MILQWNKLVGQNRVKSVIGQAFQVGALGHAYLFCGERGTGKFAAALDIAMALLCRHSEARPCGVCPACKKVASYSHPDFHIIMPLFLQNEHKKDGGSLSDEGWAFAGAEAKRRIGDPYRLPQYSGPPSIPVDWIREANSAIMRGGTEGPANAVIIDGVDTMSHMAANAMLKTLEEPPPGTVMILLTDKPHSVLQTILSRCQTMRFALLPPDTIKSELYKRVRAGAIGPGRREEVVTEEPEVITFVKKEVRKGGKKGGKNSASDNDLFGNDLFGNDLFGGAAGTDTPAGTDAGSNAEPVVKEGINADITPEIEPNIPITPDPKVETASVCGSLGVAIEEYEDAREEFYEYAAALWNDALCGNWDGATQAAERLASGDSASATALCQKTLNCLIQLMRFAFFEKFGASMNYISLGTSYQIGLPKTVAANDIERYLSLCQNALGAFKARGNPMMVMVNFACNLMEMLNGKEQ
ncbi:MAG: hypothetical protein FWC23_01180 [Chitinispirillia bacterium]|nr:hypothetical protein [Chitinispirillia bacterium]MCL2267789.1 hypothetical protein [Chitinispirillia bacterium]